MEGDCRDDMNTSFPSTNLYPAPPTLRHQPLGLSVVVEFLIIFLISHSSSKVGPLAYAYVDNFQRCLILSDKPAVLLHQSAGPKKEMK